MYRPARGLVAPRLLRHRLPVHEHARRSEARDAGLPVAPLPLRLHARTRVRHELRRVPGRQAPRILVRRTSGARGAALARPGSRWPRSFYARPVLEVARDCIGKVLVYESESGTLSGRIVEAEAYRGPEDRAAHSYGGRPHAPAPRSCSGPPGFAYVFFVYRDALSFQPGHHRENAPHAVLIRALEPLEGAAAMAERRKVAEARSCSRTRPWKTVPGVRDRPTLYGADLTRAPSTCARESAAAGSCALPRRRRLRRSKAKKPWRFTKPVAPGCLRSV